MVSITLLGAFPKKQTSDLNTVDAPSICTFNVPDAGAQHAPFDYGVCVTFDMNPYAPQIAFDIANNRFAFRCVQSTIWTNLSHTDTISLSANHGNNIYVDNSQNGGILCIANVSTGDVKVIGIPLNKTFVDETFGDIIIRRFNSYENIAIFNNSATDVGIRYIFLNL